MSHCYTDIHRTYQTWLCRVYVSYLRLLIYECHCFYCLKNPTCYMEGNCQSECRLFTETSGASGKQTLLLVKGLKDLLARTSTPSTEALLLYWRDLQHWGAGTGAQSIVAATECGTGKKPCRATVVKFHILLPASTLHCVHTFMYKQTEAWEVVTLPQGLRDCDLGQAHTKWEQCTDVWH